MSTYGIDIRRLHYPDRNSSMETPELIIGIGNSGRADDGLGWAFLDAIRDQLPDAKLEYRYQLQVEDAELISHFNSVLFVDASALEYPHGFSLSQVIPEPLDSYTSHALSPGNVTYLADLLYGQTPSVHLLAITGQEWELREGVSRKGMLNLAAALEKLRDLLY